MSEKLPIDDKKRKPPHGTVKSYVIGFALSLIFTLVPYYLVVHASFAATALLVTIIGFAVLQMVIQVVFFLHLGRERGPRWNRVFLSSTIGIIILVVAGSIWIMGHLTHNMAGMSVTDKIASDEAVHYIDGKQAGTCPGGAGVTHKIELKDNTASPSHIDAHLCDTLTIINLDDAQREIDFGVHYRHELYAGQSGEIIRAGHNMTIRLTELGTHKFHDHIEDNIVGDFTVSP